MSYFKTSTIADVSLPVGEHVIRLYFSGSFNVDYIDVSFVSGQTNEVPLVDSPIPDQNLIVDFDAYTINLNDVFSDFETSDANLIYTVSGNSKINVVISGGIATISNAIGWFGTENLIFIARDQGGMSISDQVIFDVKKSQSKF